MIFSEKARGGDISTLRPRSSLLSAIGNKSRLKILLSLWKAREEMTMYKICKATGLKRNSLSNHLRILLENELVERKIYGEIPLYTLNKSNPTVKALAEFFSKVNLRW